MWPSTVSPMRPIAAGLAALTLLALAGCTGQEPGASSPTTDASAAPAASAPAPTADPFDLIGLWRVTEADGEAAETWLRVEVGQFQLWRECGMLMGEWTALPGRLAASISGASGECAEMGTIPEVPWLASTVAFEQADDGWLLRDGAGSVTAALTVDGAPEPIPTADEMFTRPPEVDPALRASFAPPVELPASLTPETTEQLVARWIPLGFEGASGGIQPFVEFDASGGWTGSDGCNGAMGRWLLGAEGLFAATAGPTTLIGCDGANVPGWTAAARLAAFDGAELVLLDAEGTELGRFTQD